MKYKKSPFLLYFLGLEYNAYTFQYSLFMVTKFYFSISIKIKFSNLYDEEGTLQ